jgi:hypothetical protein
MIWCTTPGSAATSLLRFTLRKSERRFPPPWSVEELDACYVVRDHGGASQCRPRKKRTPAALQAIPES